MPTALYILGDLFESWIGDDARGRRASRRHRRDCARSPRSGVPCFVMHGNRDFLLAHRFCRMSGAQLLPDPLIVTLYGERGAGHARRCAVHRRSRLPTTARHGAGRRLAAAISRTAGGVAPRARRRRARRQPSAHRRPGIRHHRRQCRQRGDGVAQCRNRRPFCTATRIGPPSMPWKSTAAPARRIVLGDWYDQGSVLRWDRHGPELQSCAALGSRLARPGMKAK